MENKRKVLIVEDEVLVREGLKSVIGWDQLGMEVVGMRQTAGRHWRSMKGKGPILS